MSKRVIIEWDYDYFDNLFYQVDIVKCYTKIDSYVDIGTVRQGTQWKNCLGYNEWNQSPNGLPIDCQKNARASPIELIIATGNCIENYINEYADIRFHAEFLDSEGHLSVWCVGQISLDLNPLINYDCIKYVFPPENVSIAPRLWGLWPFPFIACDIECECCCNCC